MKLGPWEAIWDHTYGCYYYVNAKAAITQWERPSAFPNLTPEPGTLHLYLGCH